LILSTGSAENGLLVSNGNVGIGTTEPTQKLDVTGYVKGRTGLCIGNDCRTSWPSGGIPCSLKGSFPIGTCVLCGVYEHCAKYEDVPLLNCDGTKVTSITKYRCCVQCRYYDYPPGGYGY